MDRSYDVITYVLEYFHFKKPRLAIFADIIKILNMFLGKSLKAQKKLKKLEIMYQNAIFICIS